MNCREIVVHCAKCGPIAADALVGSDSLTAQELRDICALILETHIEVHHENQAGAKR